jgi:hypothetical protein
VGRSTAPVPNLLKTAALLTALLLAACNGEAPPEEAEKQEPAAPAAEAPPETPATPALLLEPVDFAALPGWQADAVSAALGGRAGNQRQRALLDRPAFALKPLKIGRNHRRKPLDRLLSPIDRLFIKGRKKPHRSSFLAEG